MALEKGSRLGGFEIVGLLGQGGMGEVYRARDMRLAREVALKVLGAAHASDPERRSRFRREALVLASLVHPHVATLFSVEESGDATALVMEIVEGPTLADRIALGAIPMDEALRIADQIVQALEAAHGKGIVHRDLKPANIKVQPDGSVKVLDFGLAGIAASRSEDSQGAPTMTVTQMAGTVMGTPAYMSPEQARGETVDARADIWAFGCVLFEMLTGQRAFVGQSTLGILASVLEREPDLATLPATTPAPLRRLLRRAFVKDRRQRLRDIADARLEIADARSQVDDPTPVAPPASYLRRLQALGAAAAVGAVVAGGMAWALTARPTTSPPVSRFAFTVPPGAAGTLAGIFYRNLAIAPDGSRIVISTANGFLVRRRDSLALEEVTAGATQFPFFSPDGQWIGYSASGTLKKIAVAGGAPMDIAPVGNSATFSWGDDGRIVYADELGVYSVSENGGTPEKLPVALLPEEQAVYPEVLPGGQAVLVTILPARSNTFGALSQSTQARIDLIDLRSGAQRTLLRGGGRPRYVPTGHLLFAVGETLSAVAFDLGALEVRGQPMQVIGDSGASDFAVSRAGTLAYVSGRHSDETELVWVDRSGREESLGAPKGLYVYPRLSPDGGRVALDVGDVNRDIWIWDVARRVMEQLTSEPAANLLPSWSPDSRRIAFATSRAALSSVYWQAADGSDQPELVLDSPRFQQPVGFAPDGRLLVSEVAPDVGREILIVSPTVTPRRANLVVGGPGNQTNPDASPDGRWIAYDSNESGQYEVYVRPFGSGASGRWRISAGGGRQPFWRRDGTELYFKDFTGALFAVAVGEGEIFVPGPAVKILDGSRYVGGGTQGGGRSYDVSLDGSRFLMLKVENPLGVTPITVAVTENWLQELTSRVPTD